MVMILCSYTPCDMQHTILRGQHDGYQYLTTSGATDSKSVCPRFGPSVKDACKNFRQIY